MPEQSTIVNPLAYKAIALDFSLWAKAGTATTQVKSTADKKQIQHVHLDHFTTLLSTSRYCAFNWTVGLGEGHSPSKKDQSRTRKVQGRNVGLVRRMLFALQMGWYSGLARLPNDSDRLDEDEDMTERFLEALGSVLRAPGGFGSDDIKAVVAYLATNLHDGKPFILATAAGLGWASFTY